MLYEKNESKYAIERKKNAMNEIACDVMNYFNVSYLFEGGRNNPDVSCE